MEALLLSLLCFCRVGELNGVCWLVLSSVGFGEGPGSVAWRVCGIMEFRAEKARSGQHARLRPGQQLL